MIHAAKIDADTALRYLRDLPDNDVLITAAHKRTTSLTVADLRALLEAARDGGWRDAESDPPPLGQDVEVEYGGIVRSGWLSAHGWVIREDTHGQWGHGASVRRWRELPR